MDVVNRVRVHPQPGETVHGLGLSYSPGGKGANQAVAVARAGGAVRMLAAVGDDSFSSTLLDHLRAEGIDTRWIQQFPGPAGMAFIAVDSAGENTIIVEGGANALLTPQVVDAAGADGVWDGVDTLLVQNEVPAETTLYAMQEAMKRGVRVVLNPAPISGVTPEWLKGVDVVVVNESEAEALTGVRLDGGDDPLDAVADAIRVLLDAGAKSAVVTLGSAGAVYGCLASEGPSSGLPSTGIQAPGLQAGAGSPPAGQQRIEHRGLFIIRQPAFAVSAVDTTAAGDTFVGAFAAAQATAEDVGWAMWFASAAAALAVTKPGAQTSVPTREEVMAFLQAHKPV
jgi:ribokinase